MQHASVCCDHSGTELAVSLRSYSLPGCEHQRCRLEHRVAVAHRYVRIAADTGLYVLPGDKCVDFPVAFMIYLIARVIEKHSCDQLTAATRKYTLWDQIRR